MNEQKMDKLITILANQQQQQQQMLQQQGQILQMFAQNMMPNNQLPSGQPTVSQNKASAPISTSSSSKTVGALMLQPASYFTTPQRRKLWWDNIEDVWKKVFKVVFQQKQMDDAVLEVIFQTKRLMLPEYNIHSPKYSIQDLTGLICLTNLIELDIRYLNLQTLKEIEHLKNLEFLNAQGNKLKTILHLASHKKLKNVYLNNNNDLSFSDIVKLRNQNISVTFHRYS
jgi:hypothetical protein